MRVVHVLLEHGEVRRHLAAAGQPLGKHPVIGLVHLDVRPGVRQDGAAAFRDLEALHFVAQVGVRRHRHSGHRAQLADRRLLGVIEIHADAEGRGLRKATAGGKHEHAGEHRTDFQIAAAVGQDGQHRAGAGLDLDGVHVWLLWVNGAGAGCPVAPRRDAEGRPECPVERSVRLVAGALRHIAQRSL
jgi:hypothetical protein